MNTKPSLALGASMIVVGLLVATVLANFSPVSAHEDGDERSELHEQMHQMMDAMMGEGHSDEMHDAMPGSEKIMEACAEAMEEGDMTGMGNMMRMMNGKDGMDGMMPGMNGMTRDGR